MITSKNNKYVIPIGKLKNKSILSINYIDFVSIINIIGRFWLKIKFS